MASVFLPALVCAVSLLLDRVFGEPRIHPLVWFGYCASVVEQKLNNRRSRLRGAAALISLVGIPVGVTWIIQSMLEDPWFRGCFDVMILAFVIGWQSMKEHGRAVSGLLKEGDLVAARKNLSLIVSRNTAGMDENLVAGSAIESVLENGHDSVFASLFWYALLGPAGALLHRLVNTLDAMWGYPNERFLNFGFAAARLDDALGWIPARLTAICYALAGSFRTGITAWKRQAGSHKSPNAGLVMASGAGALEITIGGPVSYEGQLQHKPWLGEGDRAAALDIDRAIHLVNRALVIWIATYVLVLFAVNW